MSFRSITKEKLFGLFCLLLFSVSVVYFHLSYLQENYESVKETGDRCMSELTSIKYQLKVVTDYKNRIDKLLTETQKKHDNDRQKFKDIMESCVAMKQQTVICQSQFEDLQVECKKVKENFDKLTNEIEKKKPAR